MKIDMLNYIAKSSELNVKMQCSLLYALEKLKYQSYTSHLLKVFLSI